MSQWKTKIFLDSGDPRETQAALGLLGFLDGQTTNPSLIAKNPETARRKFSRPEILEFYKKIVSEVSALIPQGSVSIEVYADEKTMAEDMLEQAREFNTWIPTSLPPITAALSPLQERVTRNGPVAHIKFPTTTEGLKATEQAIKEGMRVNMTLVFSQEQAAAVYAATAGAKKGDVFLSPFVGRLDDRGERGMDLIANIMKMYEAGDGHVEVLTASVRSSSHIEEAIKLKSDILTAPLKVLSDWKAGHLSPGDGERMGERSNLTPIPYQAISLDKPWTDYNIAHDLTTSGLTKFAADWNALIS